MFFIIFSIVVGAALVYILFLSGPKSTTSSTTAPSSKSSGSGTATPTQGNSTPTTPRRTTRPVQIIFSTQTGTAELYAKTLGREGTNLGVECEVKNIDQYGFATELPEEKLVIFVVATYGEGEPTDEATAFYDWLLESEREQGSDFLSGVKYAVFGLGDRQYKYFCQQGVDIDEKFHKLGAKRIYGLGQGDAGRNMEEEFDQWRHDLWPAVAHALHLTLKKETDEPVEPELRMRIWDEAPAALPFPKMASALEPTQKLPVYATVAGNEELLNLPASEASAPGFRRSTRLLTLDITDTLISYQSGDHLGILPCNDHATVEKYLKILGVTEEEAEKVFSLQDKNMKNVFPARVTVRTALSWYVDLSGAPKKSSLRAFAHHCTDEAEKKDFLALLQLNEQSQQRYHTLCQKLRNVYGFLQKYKSCRPPIAFFLEFMPRMAPRYFSIASDQLTHPKTIQAIVALVEDGVCTSMIARSRPSASPTTATPTTLQGSHHDDLTRFPVFIRKSNFHLPLRAKQRPLIMIGPGTGVAPLIGFLHRRRAWASRNSALGECVLFFGCRRREEDHVMKDVMNDAVRDGIISNLFVAYSREQDKKVYVQHLIAEQAELLWKLLHEGNANIYLCGDAKHMAKDVEKVLIENVIMPFSKKSKEEAAAWLEDRAKKEFYLKDVWSA